MKMENSKTLCAAVQAKLHEQLERTNHLIGMLPENHAAWTPPIPGAWRTGILLGHLLDCLAGFCAALCAAAPERLAGLSALKELPVNHDCSPAEAVSRIAAYRRALDEGFEAIDDASLAIPIPTVFVKNGESLLMLLLGNLEHLINHKHQLFTYLKLMGVDAQTPDLYRFRAENSGMRIVSLLASGTEIVCALGAGERLVGRSHECDNPAWVKALPACSEPAFDVAVSSREIDAEVNRRLRTGEPLYRLYTDLIAQLAPDLIISQAHCEVCAVTPEDVERSGCQTPAASVIALTAGTLDGIFDGIVRIAEAIGKESCGRELVAGEKRRLEGVRQRVAGKPAPSVVMLEWMEPLFAMANWGPELVQIANGELLLGKPGEHSSAIVFDRLLEADPEFIIVAPCGFDLARTLRERSVLEAHPAWNSLRAVQSGKVAYADGNLYFNRSGMTVSQTAEIIAEILHGEIFAVPTLGQHWRWA
jgi:iron complex transport system substrate-binding protein